MPSSHLILCRPLLLLPSIPPSIRVFNESTFCMRWAKYWSFSFSISPSNEGLCLQNKGLSKYQRRARRLCIHPTPRQPLGAERQAYNGQSQKAKGCCSLGSRDGIFHQTVSRFPVANHVFLGSWTVDICQECCSLRSAPQRRHTAHLGTRETEGLGWGVIKTYGPPGAVCSPSTWLPELLTPGKGHKTHSQSWSVPLPSAWAPEWLHPGKCMKCSAHLGQCPCSPWSLSSVDLGSMHRLGCSKPSVIRTLRALLTQASGILLQCPSLPTAQLNQWASISGHLCPLGSG